MGSDGHQVVTLNSMLSLEIQWTDALNLWTDLTSAQAAACVGHGWMDLVV